MKRRPSRHDICRAREFWRLLHYEPPTAKERPADQGRPDKNETTSATVAPTPADHKRERQARACLQRLVETHERRYLKRLNALIRGRSPAVVRLMEQQRGLT